MSAPVIETERLRLRGHTPADFEATAAMWADTEVVRFLGGKPSTREESWGRLLRYIGHWAALGYGFWLIEEKASGAYVGEGGFGAFKRDIATPFDAPEQGWSLARTGQGKGYGAEAMRAAVVWGQAHFGRTDFACMISPENVASLKLAEKLGYRAYDQLIYKGEQVVVLRRA